MLVNVAEVRRRLLQSLMLVMPEIELTQPLSPVRVPVGNLVEIVFHFGREFIADEVTKALFHESSDREGNPGRHQRLSLHDGISAVENCGNRGRIGRRSSNANLFHLFYERGFGVARRRDGRVPLTFNLSQNEGLAHGHDRELGILLSILRIAVFI